MSKELNRTQFRASGTVLVLVLENLKADYDYEYEHEHEHEYESKVTLCRNTAAAL